ncbi:MAG: DUF4112 domain-containing protein [Gemmatimonadetes bacterium]|nr:DUF4112 domain-containing protein [Gemmatimonadota bacterium]
MEGTRGEGPTPRTARSGEAVEARRVPEGLRAYARWMDSAVRIPGTSIRVGFDSLIGLVPGVGDLAGGALSLYPLLAAARLGAPPSLLVRMAINVGVDALVGSVPVLGDLFDVAWKANRRNVGLIERHMEDAPATRRASRGVVVAVVGIAVLALLGAVALGVAVASILVSLLG